MFHDYFIQDNKYLQSVHSIAGMKEKQRFEICEVGFRPLFLDIIMKAENITEEEFEETKWETKAEHGLCTG